MQIDLEKQPLPKKFKRHGKDYFLDTIRQRLVQVTPEEIVRQKIVSYLIHDLNVPENMIIVEAPLAHYDIDSKRRADIVVHGWSEERQCNLPLLVIECKADGVYLGDEVANQAFDYADLLGCDYVAMTDGYNVYCYRYNEKTNAYDNIRILPKYNDLLADKYEKSVIEPIPPRIKFEDLKEYVEEGYPLGIGNSTMLSKAVPATNLSDCLLDIRHKMPVGKYGIFKLIEDYGVRLLTYGNAAGGVQAGPFRSFLIEKDSSTAFVSLAIEAWSSWSKPDIERTYLDVAIDDEFAKSLGEKDLDSLRAKVVERIKADYEVASKMKLKRALLDVLDKEYNFEVPSKLIDAEYDGIVKQYEQAKKYNQLDEYEKSKDEKDLLAEYKEIALRRVKLGLLLSEIGMDAKLTILPEDINKAIAAEAQKYPGQEKAVFDYYLKNKNAVEALKAPVFEEKIVEHVLSKVKLQEKTVTAEELYSFEEDKKESKKTSKKKEK